MRPVLKNDDLIELNQINSFIFVPAIKKNFYDKILTLEGVNKPDGIIFDLEDSVDVKYKEKARDVLLDSLSAPDYRNDLSGNYLISVRINPISSKWFKDDLRLIDKIKPDILMTSKVKTANEVKKYKKIAKRLLIVVETLNGIANLQEIIKEMRGGDLFTVGYEDLSAELMIERPKKLNSFNPLSHILIESLIIARQNNIQIIDAPSRFFKTKQDLVQLKNECGYAAELGMIGKMAIHPNQICIINSVFKDKKNEMFKKANKILNKFSKLSDGSSVIVSGHNEMMDTPSYKMARKIVKHK
jgi:citrate lyase subunit beta / citryl-CoA lyase